MSNELVTYATNDVHDMAKNVLESGMFGYKNQAQAFTMLMLSQAHGLHPMTAVERYHIIQGKPAKKAETMLAEFQQAGGKVEWLVYTDKCVEGRFTCADQTSLTVEWTIDQATRAGLYAKGGNYDKYPRAMLRARVISEAIRSIMPGITVGLYTPEEIEDMANESRSRKETPVVIKDEPRGLVNNPQAQLSAPVENSVCAAPVKYANEEPAAVSPTVDTNTGEIHDRIRYYDAFMEEMKRQFRNETTPYIVWTLYHNNGQSDLQCYEIAMTRKGKGVPAIQYLRDCMRILFPDKEALCRNIQGHGVASGNILSVDYVNLQNIVEEEWLRSCNKTNGDVEEAVIAPMEAEQAPASAPVSDPFADDPNEQRAVNAAAAASNYPLRDMFALPENASSPADSQDA